MAVDAVVRFAGLRRVIPFFVKAVGEGEHVHRTEFDAVATTFAPVFNNRHQAFGDVDLLGVQGLSPECHSCFLKRWGLILAVVAEGGVCVRDVENQELTQEVQ